MSLRIFRSLVLIVALGALPAGTVSSQVISNFDFDSEGWLILGDNDAEWLMTGGNRLVAKAMLREVRSLPRQVLASRIAAALGATADGYEANVSSSTLGILGTRDRLLNPRHAAAVFGALSYATVAQFAAPHLVVQTHPAEVWAAISDEFVPAA